jgi:hypothetical protein
MSIHERCLGKSKNSLNLSGWWSGSSIFECFKNWKLLNTSFSSLPAYICWNIWLERNRALFEEGSPSIHKVAYLSISVMGDYKTPTKIKKSRRLLLGPVVRDFSGWFDGAAVSTGLNSGAGGVIRITEEHNF